MRNRRFTCKNVTAMSLLGLALLLAACGDDNVNDPPTAAIATAATGNVPLNSVVFLDGKASSDPEGAALAYNWRLLDRPAGSIAELADPTAVKAQFTADTLGDYRAELIVNDGAQDSAPATVAISVVTPAPTVTVSSPANNEVFSSNTVAVTGTVDDPGAAITVNGAAVANNAGNYTTNLTLPEGVSPITVVATNASGTGGAETNAVVNTGNNPVVVITSHKNGFIEGPILPAPPAPAMTNVTVVGFVKVNTLMIGFPDPNLPTVTINGQPAASVVRVGFLGCAAQIGQISIALCYQYFGTIAAGVAQDLQVTVNALDALSRPGSAAVNGHVDYCIKGGFDALAHYQADAGGRQNNRCHEIDGCSLYAGDNDEITVIFRNNPAAALSFPQLHNAISTAFGSGDAPPNEFYIHGNRPLSSLPCNLHDQCYQTAGTSQADCDFQKMFIGTHNICSRAYAPACPFTGLGVVNCPKWLLEKAACFDAANIYYLGDVRGGGSAHSERQAQYTLP